MKISTKAEQRIFSPDSGSIELQKLIVSRSARILPNPLLYVRPVSFFVVLIVLRCLRKRLQAALFYKGLQSCLGLCAFVNVWFFCQAICFAKIISITIFVP